MDFFSLRVKFALELLRRLLEEFRLYPPILGSIYRYEVEVEGLNPREEVRRIRGVGRYYWLSRDGTLEMGGWNEAEVVASEREVDDFSYASVFERIRNRLNESSFGVRFYGGFKFNPLDRRGERWVSFRAYRFVVPRMEVVRRGDKTYLAVNIKGGVESEIISQLYEVIELLRIWIFSETKVEKWNNGVILNRSRIDCPSYSDWLDLVRRTLMRIQTGVMDKVVLARETTFKLSRELDPMEMLIRVSPYGGWSYQFCFNPSGDRALIGLSPERLYKRISTFIETEALAGTIRRGKTEKEDEQLRQMLLESSKELMEHKIVVEMLKSDMDKLCVLSESSGPPQVVRLPTVQHLYTYFQGILRSGVDDAEILEELHPTPAVGGYPRGIALEWIRREEPIDRGVYSGPVGWVAYDSTEFCVGIRCALLQGEEISLYSGAGIVSGSRPEWEWTELECKIQSYLNVLGNGVD